MGLIGLTSGGQQSCVPSGGRIRFCLSQLLEAACLLGSWLRIISPSASVITSLSLTLILLPPSSKDACVILGPPVDPGSSPHREALGLITAA